MFNTAETSALQSGLHAQQDLYIYVTCAGLSQLAGDELAAAAKGLTHK